MDEHTAVGLRRVLMLTQGAPARAVAEQTLALGQAWFGLEPPVARVDLAEGAAWGVVDAGALAMLTEACDRLADGEMISRLEQAGWRLARPDEIEAWLLITTDHAPDTAPLQTAPAGEHAGMNDTGSALIAALTQLAWRRLRVHVTARALLLAEPAAQEHAAAWAAQLAAAGVERIGLAGPVSIERVRWDPPRWQARAACGLATLLWSAAELGADGAGGVETPGWPAPVGLTEATPAFEIWAIGAAAWPTPWPELRRLLAPRCARRVVTRLLGAPAGAPTASPAGDTDLPPWELPPLAVAPERHRLAVDTATPADPPGLVWGGRRPNWGALATLPEGLRTQAEQRVAAAQQEQYEPRGAWLAGQVDAWSAALDRLRSARLTPDDGWPEPVRYETELRTLTAQLRAACARIEDWLEAAGVRFAQAEAEVTRAAADVTALCRRFPTPSPDGLLTTLMRPWRWPALAWAYLVLLPHKGQRCLDAYYRLGEARRAEANLHALRQAYLAMAQVTQEHQRATAALMEALRALAEALTHDESEAVALPAPWDDDRLDTLAQRLLRGRGPGVSWLMGGADAPDSGRAGLLAWVTAQLAPLRTRSAADWLAGGLDDPDLARWLSSCVAEAAPLWPAGQADTITWLLCPARRLETPAAQPQAEKRLQDGLRAWATRQAAEGDILRAGVSQPDALLFLRTIRVRLTDGAAAEPAPSVCAAGETAGRARRFQPLTC
jgi:hypothetical protein